MKIRTIATALFLLSCETLSQELLIDNVSVVSAHFDGKQSGQNIRIIDGRITDVSSTALKPLTENPTRIDGTGKYLSPGVMDSHVHVGSVPGIGFIDSQMALTHSALVNDYLQQQPKSFLYYGVTQVLNLGSSDGREAFEASTLHPDYYTCQPIPVVGGYPALDADYTVSNSPYFIIEPGMDIALPAHIDPAKHTPEAVVAAIAETEAACIKIYIEDGFGSASHWPMLSDATLSRIRKAASEHQLQLWAHANAIDMYQIALKHNINGIAHGLWNWQWPEDEENPPVTSTLDQLVATDTAYMPTIQVMLALQGMYDENALAQSAEVRQKVLPQSLLTWFETTDGQWFKREITADFDNLPDSKIHELLGYGIRRARQSANYLASKGHPLLLASDYPSSPSFAAAPGLSTFAEIKHMALAGMSPDIIFKAATFNGPEQFGLLQDYGTVEPGKVANLVLLSRNPRTDVMNWDSIEWIILRGKPVKRHQLAANQ